jgi:hypothetical protein
MNNTLILPVCSHCHHCKHTVAPKHSFLGETMASTNETMFDTLTKNKNGKLLLKVGKKPALSKVLIPLVFESSPSTTSTVSARSLMDFLSLSSPSLLSVVLQTSLLTLTTSTLKKRLILNDNNKPKKKTKRVESKAKELKLAAYDIDWFNSTLTTNECLKHTSSTNLPSTQEEQLTFHLSKYQASDIKTAFADAIGKVGRAARKVFDDLSLDRPDP